MYVPQHHVDLMKIKHIKVKLKTNVCFAVLMNLRKKKKKLKTINNVK